LRPVSLGYESAVCYEVANRVHKVLGAEWLLHRPAGPESRGHTLIGRSSHVDDRKSLAEIHEFRRIVSDYQTERFRPRTQHLQCFFHASPDHTIPPARKNVAYQLADKRIFTYSNRAAVHMLPVTPFLGLRRSGHNPPKCVTSKRRCGWSPVRCRILHRTPTPQRRISCGSLASVKPIKSTAAGAATECGKGECRQGQRQWSALPREPDVMPPTTWTLRKRRRNEFCGPLALGARGGSHELPRVS